MTQTSAIELFEVLTVKNRFCHRHGASLSSFASVVKDVDYKLPVSSEQNDG